MEAIESSECIQNMALLCISNVQYGFYCGNFVIRMYFKGLKYALNIFECNKLILVHWRS